VAQEVASVRGIPRVFEKNEQLLADSSIAILDIAIPPDKQLAIASAAVRHNDCIKGILCQKPLATFYADAYEIVGPLRRSWKSPRGQSEYAISLKVPVSTDLDKSRIFGAGRERTLHMLTRRTFLEALALGAAGWVGARPSLRIGIMDTVLQSAGKSEAIPIAHSLGFRGVQVTLGRSKDMETLPLEEKVVEDAYLEASKNAGIPINSTYLDMLHVSCLKSAPDASKWVEKGIAITKRLHASILMTVFFGKCSVLSRQELNHVIDIFRDLVSEAEKAGVVIGFENTLSGEDNRYAVDRMNSKAFKVWYDVGNSTFNGYDVPAEIRMLGRDRICEFHFKDKGYLGEGKVQFKPILQAIRDIDFVGYANLETTSPSGNVKADAKENLDFLRRLMSGSSLT
jgi:L-ribulose-5-phosphate 3-epimerase